MTAMNSNDPLTWDLSVLYESFEDPRFAADMAQIRVTADETIRFLREAQRQSPGVAQLESVVRIMQRLRTLTANVSSFINLVLATDAENAAGLAFQSELNTYDPQFGMIDSLVCRIAGTAVAQNTLDTLIAASPLLQEHEFWLKEAARESAHLIPPEMEETVFQLQVSGSTAWSQLRDMLDGTATVAIEIDGVPQELPLPQVRNMAYDADPEIRKAAYYAELASYKKNEIPLSFALNGIKAEGSVIAKLKGYDSLLEQTLAESRMSKKTLDSMIAAMESSLPVFRRYFKAKARYLGHENGLPFYDLFAPVGSAAAMQTYTVEEARAFLVSVMRRFNERMPVFIDTAFNDRWIDMYPRAGKGGGAFCHGLYPQKQSRVLTNFTGSFSDVTTLAHELGHAYHDSCLNGASILNCDYPMPLAETASIFNETLVTKAALASAGPDRELYLLETQISDAAQVIVDILSRFYFESAVVEASRSRRMTVEELQRAMVDAQLRTYGDGLDPRYLHNDLWVCKCHYYFPECHFYNFPYAFGLLFSKGLYALFCRDKADFVQKYDRLLAAAGRATVEDTAALAGIDVADGAFWKSSLDVIAEDISRFEALTGKKS